MPTQRDVLAVKDYAEWLGRFPWQLFATLTFAWRVSDEQADKAFCSFINEAERQIRSQIAFIRGDEKRFSGCGMPAAPRHYHLLLTSRVQLNPVNMTHRWRHFGGSGVGQDSAIIERCESPVKAAEYCLKFINETEGDWKLRNLDLFLPGSMPANLDMRGRRRQRRDAARLS
jgi:hypothetical protein